MYPGRFVILVTCVLFVAAPIEAASREVIKTDWDGFRRQVGTRGLENRKVTVQLAGGGEVNSRFLRATESGVVIRSVRAARQWKSGDKEATIPKDQIRSVGFPEHRGHRGAIAGLASFGASLGVAAAAASSQDAFEITEGPLAILVPVCVVAGAVGLGLAGYFIGRSTSPRGPEFVIVP